MSERIADRLRRGYGDFNREGVDGIVGLLDPDVVWISREGDSYAGHEGARSWHQRALESFEAIRFEPLSLVDTGGGRILAELTVHVRTAGSGVELDREVAHLWTFDDAGRATRLEMFADVDRARAAAGLVGG